MRSPTSSSKKFSSFRNGLLTSATRMSKSGFRVPISRLALFVFIVSLLLASFFFILSIFSTPASDNGSDHLMRIPLPRPLISVLDEQQREGRGVVNANKKVRVCIVTMEIGFSSPGGIGTAYTGLALTLVEKGHDVTVLFVDDNRHTREEWDEILAPLEELGIKIRYMESIPTTGCYYSCQRSYRIYQWLKVNDGSFDVVHFHDNGGLAFYSTRAKSQGLALANTVICVGAHGPHMWVLEWNRETVDSLVHMEVDEMERSSVLLSDVMISPSAYMPTWMTNQGWQLPPQSFVHPNILSANIEPNPNVPKAETVAGQPVKVKELVFFGRLERRKGLWIFLDALDAIYNENPFAFNNTIITFLGRDTVFRDPTKKNRESKASQETEAFCRVRGWNCIYMLNMDHVGAIRYLQYSGIVAVMPSPMDNSPNVVSECLMYSIPFVAFEVGGIPELIHEDDRQRVLSKPDSESLSEKLIDVMTNGAYRARMAMESNVRAKVWIDWHIAAKSEPRPLAPPPLKRPTVSLCLFYNPEKWGNFYLDYVMKSLRAQKSYETMPWEVLVFVKSMYSGLDDTVAHPLRTRIIQHRLEESDIVQMYGYAVTQATTDYAVLLDPVSWLNGDASIQTLVDVATRTNAQIVTAQSILNDTTQSTLLHLGSVGMYSSIVNCIGDWNMLVKTEAFVSLLPFERGDDIWRVYARAMMRGLNLESVPEALFYQSIRISRDVDHRNTLEVNREFRPMFLRPYDSLVMVTQGFIKTKRLHDMEEEQLRQDYESMTNELAMYKSMIKAGMGNNETRQAFSPLVPTLQHAKFFFVRGFEKSGTSWLRDVVGLHPEIHIAPWEFHFEIMTRAVDQFSSKHWQAARPPYKAVTEKWWLDFIPALLAAGIPEDMHSKVKWIGEKTPSAVEPLLPGAKYVTIIRDGRDVTVSLFFHFANLGGFDGFCPLGYLIEHDDVEQYRSNKEYFDTYPEKLLALEPCVRNIARMWAERVKSDLAIMNNLNTVSPRSAHFLFYERLIEDCDGERAKVYQFFDLDPAAAEPLSRVGWTLPGFGGADKTQRNPFYRKGISGDWKNYMIGKSKDWFKEEAGDLLVELGYEKDKNW